MAIPSDSTRRVEAVHAPVPLLGPDLAAAPHAPGDSRWISISSTASMHFALSDDSM